MPVAKATISGSPYLGVYLRVGEKVAVAPPSCPGDLVRKLERVLGVRVVQSRVEETELIGSLLAFNDHGGVLSGELALSDRAALEGVGLRLAEMKGRLSALGNIVLANNKGAVCHPDFTPEQRHVLADVLGVPVVPGTVAGLGTVAMAAVATDKGVVVHPRATPAEVQALEAALGVPAHRSTANFGIPLVGACIVANSRGLLVGDLTTPVEIVHLQEGLKVYD